MKRKKFTVGVPLDEVFAESEKDPRWKAGYAKAGVEVRLAIAIAQAREKARLNQKQLAAVIGTTQSGISRIEKGAQNLTVGTLRKIAKACGQHLVIEFRP